jgi:hypothetical protein
MTGRKPAIITTIKKMLANILMGDIIPNIQRAIRNKEQNILKTFIANIFWRFTFEAEHL